MTILGPIESLPAAGPTGSSPTRREGRVLDDLVALSLEMGDPARDLTILAEGNTSARIDGEAFWVKASGARLERADAPHAFVAVHCAPLLDALATPGLADAEAKAALLDARVEGQDSQLVPSIETYVHAVCLARAGARFVAQTHPTPLTALLCARDAEALYAGVLYPDEAVVCGPRPLIVPYAEPGIALGRALLAVLDDHFAEHGAAPRVILLRNHGLVALGATAQEAAAVTAMAVKAARVRLAALPAGPLVFLPAGQAERLFGREDERSRRERLAGRHG